MNIPNILTIIRIILVPIFIITFFLVSKWVALSVFIIAGITDLLDGYIARKYDMVTDLGAVLDPFADKLMLMSVIIVFTISGYIPVFVLIIILTKELFMIYGGARFYFAKKKIVIPANRYGKASTVLFYVSIIVITFDISDIANNILMLSVVISTIIAFVSYYKIARNEMKKW
jgi:cardiolipin synthase